MLFSTCTISEQENEDNLARFLAENSNFVPESIEFAPQFFDGAASLQVLPQRHAMEGFFYARLRRLS